MSLTKNNFKHLILILISAGVSIISVGTGLINPIEDLIQKYNEYQKRYPQVKLTLVTNQPIYSPGDTIYFSTWYTQEDLTPVSGQHLLTIEFWDEWGVNHQTARIKVANGKGYNQLAVPHSLKPGVYMLVAYSDWMKNFGTAWYYQKPVQIVRNNALRVDHKNRAGISIYPEGGQLIGGIKTKLGITGPGSSVVTILSEDQPVVIVQLDSTGFGICELTAASEKLYQVQANSTTLNNNFRVRSDGVSVRLHDTTRGIFEVKTPPVSKYQDQSLIALIISQGKIIRQKEFKLDKSPSMFLQFGDFLSSAIHILYIFNEQHELLAERIFIPESRIQPKLEIDIPQVIKQRELQTLSLELKDEYGHGLEGDFAISIVQSSLFDSFCNVNTFYLSDLPDVMDQTTRTRDITNYFINEFLITQQWNRINWQNILKANYPPTKYPFRSSFSLIGEVIDASGDKVSTDSLLLVTYLLSNTMGYETQVRQGRFEISYMGDFSGNDRAFMGLQLGNQIRDDYYRIKLLNDSLAFHNPYQSTELDIPSNYGWYASRKKIIDQSYSVFELSNQVKNTVTNSSNHFEEEYNGADYLVNLANYVVFPSMKDLIHEVIPFIKFRTKKNEYSLRVLFRDSYGTRVYEPNPLIMIDGIMTRNISYFMNLNPADILSIKIINNPNKLSRLGLIGKSGVILVTSRKGNLGEPLLQTNYVNVVGLTKAVLPTVKNLSEKIPVTTPNLYWNPNAQIGKTGRAQFEFTTTDDTGRMNILIHGVSSTGKAIVAEKEVEVLFKK